MPHAHAALHVHEAFCALVDRWGVRLTTNQGALESETAPENESAGRRAQACRGHESAVVLSASTEFQCERENFSV